jgi:hypothetical protein
MNWIKKVIRIGVSKLFVKQATLRTIPRTRGVQALDKFSPADYHSIKYSPLNFYSQSSHTEYKKSETSPKTYAFETKGLLDISKNSLQFEL